MGWYRSFFLLLGSILLTGCVFNPLARVGPVELVRGDFRFVEGPVWSPARQVLYFTDIPADRIYALKDGKISVFLEPSGQANGLYLDQADNLHLCEHDRRLVSFRSAAGKTRVLADRFGPGRLNSPNDLVIRTDGQIYFSDPPYGLRGRPREQDQNHVFRLAPDGFLQIIWAGERETRPNGVHLSPDQGTLYVAFTRSGLVRAFTLDGKGNASSSRVFARTKGGADGMTVDPRGNLYVATLAGIEVFSPAGKRWGVISLPEKPTNCTFGGAGGKTLFVTARTGLYRVDLR